MTGKREKQLAIQKSVMQVMELHTAKWQGVTEVKNKYDMFVRNIKKIDDDLSMIATDLAPLKEKTGNARKALVEGVFPVVSVLGVFASDMGDKKLTRLVDLNDGELEKMKSESLKKYCNQIIKTSKKLLAPAGEDAKKAPKHELSGYGLNNGHIEKAEKALESFIREEAGYLDTRIKRKKSQAKLEQRISENNRLLKRNLDRMVPLFRDTQKAFHDAYIKARVATAPARPAEPKTASGPAKPSKPAPTSKKPAPSKATATTKRASTTKRTTTSKQATTAKSGTRAASGTKANPGTSPAPAGPVKKRKPSTSPGTGKPAGEGS